MAQYWLYIVDDPGGRFVDCESIVATDDEAARHTAERFRGPRRMELWCGARKVAAIPARD